jgi:hypothetical protein
MKHLPVLIVLGLALSLCNLTNRLKQAGNSNQPSSSNSNSGGGSDASAERAQLSPPEIAALAGGQEIKWEQQGMSWTVPAKWTQSTNETKTFMWRSPGGSDAANLIVNISPMDESFPTDVSIKAFYDGAKTRSKNGEVDELKWLEVDGLKGIQFRESKPEKDDDIRRMQWMAYRKYAGQVQLVNVILSSDSKGFTHHQDEMYGVLHSMKIVH